MSRNSDEKRIKSERDWSVSGRSALFVAVSGAPANRRPSARQSARGPSSNAEASLRSPSASRAHGRRSLMKLERRSACAEARAFPCALRFFEAHRTRPLQASHRNRHSAPDRLRHDGRRAWRGQRSAVQLLQLPVGGPGHRGDRGRKSCRHAPQGHRPQRAGDRGIHRQYRRRRLGRGHERLRRSLSATRR